MPVYSPTFLLKNLIPHEAQESSTKEFSIVLLRMIWIQIALW